MHAPENRGDRLDAFTLIELLAVIAITAVLVALLLPGLSRAKNAAYSVRCKGNLKQATLGLRMYVDDYAFYPPENALPPMRHRYWYQYLEPYLMSTWTNDLYRCPAYKGSMTFRDPESFHPVLSYGYNRGGVGYATTQTLYGLGLGGRQIFRHPDHPQPFSAVTPDSAVVVPSDMIALGDAFLAADTKVIIENHGFGRWAVSQPEHMNASLAARSRHDGKLNVAFCDGHVEAVKVGRLFGPLDSDRMRWNVDHRSHREVAW